MPGGSGPAISAGTRASSNRTGAASSPQRRRHGHRVIDPSRWLCAGQMCPPIIGNIIVYRDKNHLSVAYARTLTP
jgi:hypothetical protein